MDLDNRSRRQDAEVGVRFGDKVVPIRWYPCAPGAQAFPAAHAFISPKWEDEKDKWSEGPGVHTAYSQRSSRYQAPPGTHYHGTLAWFLTGIPAEVLSGEVPPPPPDPECPVPLSVRDVSGGVLNATYDDVVVIDCDRARGQVVEQMEQGRVRLYDLPVQAALRQIELTTAIADPDRVAVRLTAADSGACLCAQQLQGSYRAFLPRAADLRPGFYLWAFQPLTSTPTNNIVVHPFEGETTQVIGFGEVVLGRTAPGTSLWILTGTGPGVTQWRQLIPYIQPLPPITIGSPVGGGVAGDVLGVDSGGLLRRISGGRTGRFGGP